MFITITRSMLRRVTAAAAAFAVVAALFMMFPQGKTEQTAAADGNWGLSFRAEGQQPEGNVSAGELRQWDAYYVGDTAEKVIYLTFDAGYENGCTAAILDALKKHSAPACFFVVGNYIDTAPELVLRMVQEGHIVGNHTLHHPDMSAIQDEASFSAELDGLADKYLELTGEEMKKFYRPPQGKFSESNLAMAQKLGYRTIFWSLAYVDWYTDDQPTDEQAFSKLVPRIHPGAVVLLRASSMSCSQSGRRSATASPRSRSSRAKGRNERASRVVLEQLRQLGIAPQRDAAAERFPVGARQRAHIDRRRKDDLAVLRDGQVRAVRTGDERGGVCGNGGRRTDGAHGKDEHDGGKEQKDQERGGALPRMTACEQKKSL